MQCVHCSAMESNTVQCSSVKKEQCSRVQCTFRYSWTNIELWLHKITRVDAIILYSTSIYRTVLYCTVLYCTVLYCTFLYWIVLCSPTFFPDPTLPLNIYTTSRSSDKIGIIDSQIRSLLPKRVKLEAVMKQKKVESKSIKRTYIFGVKYLVDLISRVPVAL